MTSSGVLIIIGATLAFIGIGVIWWLVDGWWHK
jgi:hypothetical protein